MKGFLKKLKDSYIIPAVVMLGLFIVKFWPLLDISRYNHSNADDFWMSSGVHFVWENTHSVLKTLQYDFVTTAALWKNWDGCFVSMLIGSIPPVVFDEELYKYTFTIIAGILILGITWLLYEVLVRLLKFPAVHYILILFAVLILYTNFTPSIKDAFYWWVGGINYTFMTGIMFISQACLVEYIVSSRRGFLVIGSFFAFITGVGNLLTALINPLILIAELIVLILAYKKDKLLYIIPVVSGIAGLMFNVLAPGNLIRGGDELFSNPIISSIIRAITSSTVLIGDYYRRPMGWIFLFVLAVVCDAMRRKTSGFKFRYPVIFVIVTYGIYCAVFAPVIYAGSAFYGRVKNVSFFIMVLMFLFNAIYILGWFFERYDISIKKAVLQVLVYAALIFVVFTCCADRAYFDSAYAKESVKVGQAQDFDRRVMERFAIYYNNDIKQVEVPEITWIPNIFYWDDDCLEDIAWYFHKEYIKVVSD